MRLLVGAQAVNAEHEKRPRVDGGHAETIPNLLLCGVMTSYRMSLKEFLYSSLICLGCILLYFQKPLLSTGINQASMLRLDASEGLVGASEDLYLGYPPYYYSSQEVRRGRLPLWTPHACGGTPFMGNQNSGIFSPLHLIFYLVPQGGIQYLWIVLFALCFYTAWSFTFVLARWYGIGFTGAVFAAGWYAFSGAMTSYKIEMPGQSAVFTPGLFLAAEQFLHGNRRRGLILLPWLVALPVLSGHFQISFYAWMTVGIYVLSSLAANKSLSLPSVADKAIAFVAAAALGLVIAAGPMAAALEYVSHSYTKVWRSLPEFGWTFERVSKSLSEGDAGSLAAAALSLWCFVVFLKRLKLREEQAPAAWFSWGLAVAALGSATACLMNVGMFSPLLLLSRFIYNFFSFQDPLALFSAVVLYFLVLVAQLDARLPQGLKILSFLALFGSLLYLKTPVLTHLLYDLPLLKNLHLFNYNTSINLGLALLAGYGLTRWARLVDEVRSPQLWLKTAQGAGLVVAGLFLGHLLQEPLAQRLGMGVNPRFFNAAASGAAGGIADAGQVTLLSSRHTVRGWIAGNQPVQSVLVGFQQAGKAPELVAADLSRRSGRIDFSRRVSLPPGGGTPVAVLVNPQGEQKVWRGSDVARQPWPSNAVGIGLPALFLLLPLTLLTPHALKAGRWFSGAGGLLLLVHVFHFGLVDTGAGLRDNMTRPWPGLEKLIADKETYRINSFDAYFFPPGLSGVYGISDIRNGSDVLDVVTMIHFIHLTMAVVEAGRQQGQEWGSRLLGWGNVKYILAKPGRPLADKAFQLIYQGADMLVYLNNNFQPRLRFMERWKYMDGKGLWEWRKGRELLGAVYNGILQKNIDPEKDLLLHDVPEGGLPAASAPERPAEQAEVTVLEEDVDLISASVTAPRPGFLFLSSNYYPGWKCYIDGRPAKLLRSWLTFCAVAVPAGRHQIRFVYDSWLVNAGLLLSVMGTLFWAAWWWRGPGASVGDLQIQAPPLKKKSAQAAAPPVADGSYFIEVFLTGLVGGNILFWLNWCAWFYRGGTAVNFSAGLLLLAAAAAAVRRCYTLRQP
jgi:hypothetical protein